MTLDWRTLSVEKDSHKVTSCECCATKTHQCVGDVLQGEDWICWFTARWTDGHMDRGLSLDLFYGDWSEGADAKTRWIIGTLYRKSENAFMVQDARDLNRWPNANATVLNRDDVIGTPFAKDVFAALDAIIMGDRRLGIWIQ